MPKLEEQFETAMFDVYRRAKSEAKYNATVFLKMLSDRGGVDTARYLVNQIKPSDGYTELHLRQRLDLTVEALIIEDARWHSLFTREELQKAKDRLEKYGYKSSAI